MRDGRRVLFAILVYNGRAFVPDAIRSAARLSRRDGSHEVDVLALDDCSTQPGWSDELAAICEQVGAQYYRSPRNLGIPRNMNLALLRAMDQDYDDVILCNSDVVVPQHLVDTMVGVAETTPNVGSVTAWSNNVSIFSLPNADPDANLAHQGAVDFVSDALGGEFGTSGFEVPTAVGFCMLIPTAVVRRVGLLDPVFGRGYCEEVDWCLRAGSLEYRHVLAPGCFVYHVGNATTREAGILERNQFTSWANEAIIDMRHPGYRSALAEFDTSSQLAALMTRGVTAIVVAAAREWGYAIEASWLHRDNRADRVQFVVAPQGGPSVVAGRFQGFEIGIPLDSTGVVDSIERLVGRPPNRVSVFEAGRRADELLDQATERDLQATVAPSYPERV